MSDIDNKVVSITFNNKQFMQDIADTVSAIEDLNKVTNGKNIDTSGLENLRKAFQTTTSGVTSDAAKVTDAINDIIKASDSDFKTGGIDSLRKALENAGMTAVDVEDTIASLQQISKTGISYADSFGISNTAHTMQEEADQTRNVIVHDINDVANNFDMLKVIGMGAMIAIGEQAVSLGQNALSRLTSGLRDGWAEYNLLTNSTQTILANTERYGTTMDDVSDALGELNRYADLTTYAFSDMTRNIGYFTTAGINLEDSVTAIQGLSNVGALFGADAQAVARAGYQMSQAMSAGVIRLMDWRSMVNAGMGGKVLQDELIRTAAVMSGTSIDAMNDYIESLGGFNQSLQEGWLTSDIFLEAMKTFAGQTREYYESLTDANGNRLYTDEEIDDLVKLGETAMESATKVKTFQQMMDAFAESIGSGWQQTFSFIIGDLEEAKEFWTPINDILTSMVNGFFSLQNGALAAWDALGGRREMINGLMNVLSSLQSILQAIGRAVIDVFMGPHTIGNRLYLMTEAITDFTESLVLSDEELADFQDFIGGLLEPIKLITDVIFELVRAFFDSGEAANRYNGYMEQTGSMFSGIRSAIMLFLGSFGRLLKAGAEFIRKNNAVKKAVTAFAKVVKGAVSVILKVISAPFVLLYNLWQKYDLGTKMEELWLKVAEFFLPIIDAVNQVKDTFTDWFSTLKTQFDSVLGQFGGPVEIFIDTFNKVKQLFEDLFDPTVSISEAIGNFIDGIKEGGLAGIFDVIKTSISDLWDKLKETTIGQWFEDTKTKIQNAWTQLSQTPFGQWIGDVVTNLKDFLGLNTIDWDSFWTTTESVMTTIADKIETGWSKIKTFFSELVDILKDWFGLSDEVNETIEETSDTMTGATGGGPFVGQIAEMSVAGDMFQDFVVKCADGLSYAEKNTPDPENSNFLDFLAQIPEALRDISESLVSGSIVESIVDGFRDLIDPIREFFSQDFDSMKEDVLGWFSDKLEKFQDIIGTLIGIDGFRFSDYSVFEIVGGMIVSIINVFGDIDPQALNNVQRIVNMICQLMLVFIQLKVAQTAALFASGLRAAGKGWLQAQKAANNLAKAAKWGAIGKTFLAIAIMLVAVFGTILGVAYMIKHDYGPELGIAFAGVIAILGILILFMVAITKHAKNISAESKVLTGVHKTISEVSRLIMTIVLSIASMLALGVVLSLLISKGYLDVKTFQQSMLVVGIMLMIIAGMVAGLVVATGILAASAKGTDDHTFNKVASVFSAISRLLVSVVILVGGLLASIMIFTLFVQNFIKDDRDVGILIGSVAMIAVLMIGAGLAVRYLISVANKISSETSKVDPKKFTAIILVLSGLFIVLAAVTIGLVAAISVLVGVMSQTGDNVAAKFIGATLIILALLWSVFGCITMLINQIIKMPDKGMGKVLGSFAIIAVFLAALGVGVAMLVRYISIVSNQIANTGAFIAAIASVAGMLVLLIATAQWIIYILSNKIDGRKITKERINILTNIMANILLALLAISTSMAIMAAVVGHFGLSNSAIWSIFGTIAILLAVVSGITVLFGVLATNGVIDTDQMLSAGMALSIASIALVAIAGALSLVGSYVKNIDFLERAALAIGTLFAILSVAMGFFMGIAQMNTSTLLIAAGALVLASGSFLVIAAALKSIASIDISSLKTAGIVLGGLLGTLGVLMIILGLIGNIGGGMGAVVIIAIAGALVLASSSFLIFAAAIQQTAEGISMFVTAFNLLATVDFDLITAKFKTLISLIPELAQTLASSATQLGAAVRSVVQSIVSAAFNGLSDTVGAGISAMCNMIITYAPLIGQAATVLGMTLLSTIQIQVEALCAMIARDFGPGGIVRDLASNLADFVTWLAGKIGGWAVDLVDAFLTGLADSLSEENKIARIITALEILYLSLKRGVMDAIGVPNFTALGAGIAMDILDGLIQGFQNAINVFAPAQLALLDSVLGEYGTSTNELIEGFQDTLTTASGMAYGDAFDSTSVGEEIDSLRARMDELASSTDEAASNFSILDPVGMINSFRDSTYSANRSSNSLFSTIIDGVRELLGISEDFSITDLLGEFDLGSLFGGAGLDISGMTEGLGDMGDMMGSMDTSNMLNFDTSSLTATNLELGNITDTMSTDEFQNPVITPVVDDSQVELGINNIEDMFNNADIDSFAVDAGHSILMSQRSEGDASTDGNVSVQYIQNNYSPEALSPIQLYRDSQTLLRGRFNS